VHGHQRHGHEQLVFHQVQKIELARKDQHVFLRLLVLHGGQGLVGDKAKVPLKGKPDPGRAQAALAFQGQLAMSADMQPDLRMAGGVKTFAAGGMEMSLPSCAASTDCAYRRGRSAIAVLPGSCPPERAKAASGSILGS